MTFFRENKDRCAAFCGHKNLLNFGKKVGWFGTLGTSESLPKREINNTLISWSFYSCPEYLRFKGKFLNSTINTWHEVLKIKRVPQKELSDSWLFLWNGKRFQRDILNAAILCLLRLKSQSFHTFSSWITFWRWLWRPDSRFIIKITIYDKKP